MTCKQGKKEKTRCKNEWFPCYDTQDKQCYSLDGTLLLDPVGDMVDTGLDIYNRAFDFMFQLLGGPVPAEDSEIRRRILERDNARLRSYGPFRPLGDQGVSSDGMEATVRASEKAPYLGTMAPSIIPYLVTAEEMVVPPPVERARQRSEEHGRGTRQKRKQYRKKKSRRRHRVRLRQKQPRTSRRKLKRRHRQKSRKRKVRYAPR